MLSGLGNRHALLYFFAGDAVWLADVRHRRVKLRRLLVTAAALEGLVGRFLGDPGDAAAAETLGSVLLPSGALAPEEEFYVVAMGPLAGVPFAALRQQGRALVEEHVVHYVPSLTALTAIVRSRREHAGPTIVLGDPHGNLPEARAEAVSVAHRMGVEPFVGARATREALRGVERADLLHVAAHAGVGLQGAWLELADGELTSGDVLRLRLQLRLVVLSACATSATRAKELWGSMSASFLAAGSHAVLASLWSVQDAGTRALAERFYQEGGANRPSAALARAQRWLAARGMPASAWAAFVVLGE